ncbi:MAG: biotin transporter BioY [Halocynthiibacter sp.]
MSENIDNIGVKPRNIPFLKSVLRVGVAVGLLTLSAKVQVPFWPVPMTLQILVLMGIAATLGMRQGLASVGAYFLMGAMGFAVFAGTPEKGIGIAYMLGATGGYLAGFLVATGIVGFAADRFHKFAVAPAMLLGLVAIYVLGLAWLAQFVPADKVLAYGFTPFIAGDFLKVGIAALAFIGLPAAWARWLRGSADQE